MSLWKWLTGRRRIEQPDLIWLTDRYRMEGVCNRIKEKLFQCRVILVTSHFTDRLEELRRLLDRDSIAFHYVESALRSDQVFQQLGPQRHGATVLLVPAARLDATEKADHSFDSPDRTLILAIERHPLRDFDDQINRFAEAVLSQIELQFFIALDDVLMKVFAGAWVREVLQKMGMKDNESINSLSVSRRLKSAQHKIAKRYEVTQGMSGGAALDRAGGNRDRLWKSAEEWMAANGLEIESLS